MGVIVLSSLYEVFLSGDDFVVGSVSMGGYTYNASESLSLELAEQLDARHPSSLSPFFHRNRVGMDTYLFESREAVLSHILDWFSRTQQEGALVYDGEVIAATA